MAASAVIGLIEPEPTSVPTDVPLDGPGHLVQLASENVTDGEARDGDSV